MEKMLFGAMQLNGGLAGPWGVQGTPGVGTAGFEGCAGPETPVFWLTVA